MHHSLQKYRIGLGVLGVATIVLLVVVIMEAGNSRIDTQTYQKANEAATKLNGYIYRQDSIPATLEETGITGVPSSVSYRKLSDSRYEFCVTYKADSDNFSGSNLAEDLVSGGTDQGYTYNSSDSSSDDTSSESSTLYLSSEHHKGQNCQTVKPYIYNDGGQSIDPYSNSDYDPTTYDQAQ